MDEFDASNRLRALEMDSLRLTCANAFSDANPPSLKFVAGRVVAVAFAQGCSVHTEAP
jgi:hypothetical protein